MTEEQKRESDATLELILKTCPNPILIGYGGSIAYGTSTPKSDVDIRGIFMNPLSEFIGTRPDSEQFMPSGSDTTIYSIKKMFKLLFDCNPNTIELLGLKSEHYLYVDKIGERILDNRDVFLSQKAGYTFGNYAKAQLNRLVNKSGRAKSESGGNEARSISKALNHLKHNEGINGFDAYVKEKDGPVCIAADGSFDINDFCRAAGEILNIHSDYCKSTRNDKAVKHDKIEKHAMHLVRLYLMGIDILEGKGVITYRGSDLALLQDIRSGKFMESDGVTPNSAFNDMVALLSDRFDYAWAHSPLPERPDAERVNDLMMTCVSEFYDLDLALREGPGV